MYSLGIRTTDRSGIQILNQLVNGSVFKWHPNTRQATIQPQDTGVWFMAYFFIFGPVFKQFLENQTCVYKMFGEKRACAPS